MTEPISTPRVSSQYLGQFMNRNVIIVGKVLQLRGDSAVMDSQGNVTLMLNRDAHLVNGNGAEIIGKVNPDLSVKVLTSKDLGPNVDYDLYQKVVDATQQFPDIYQCAPEH